jgi:hypothetical protein
MNEQWKGRKWYCYGTSMTDSSGAGVFSKYLAKYAGLEEHNFGKGGSGIVAAAHDKDDNVKTRVMRLDDGKAEADLITVELVPNDVTKATLGEVTDLSDDTFCGNLHQILQYLQVNTSAVIVVLIASRAIYSVPTGDYGMKRLQWESAVETICNMHGIQCWNGGKEAGLGYYRMKDKEGYLKDLIHLDEKGGEILAKYYWGKLQQIYPND